MYYLAPAKEREWDNIITCHSDHNRAYTWNFENKVQGRHTLVTTDPKQTSIRVCVSYFTPIIGIQ